MNNLQVGTIYQSTTHGIVEYRGTDLYWGELTFHFRSHTYRRETYIKPEELEKFLVPQESIETVKQQRDDLLAALEFAVAEAVADHLDAWYSNAQEAIAKVKDAHHG